MFEKMGAARVRRLKACVAANSGLFEWYSTVILRFHIVPLKDTAQTHTSFNSSLDHSMALSTDTPQTQTTRAFPKWAPLPPSPPTPDPQTGSGALFRFPTMGPVLFFF